MQVFHVSMEETAVVLAVTTHVGVPVAFKVQLVNKVAYFPALISIIVHF